MLTTTKKFAAAYETSEDEPKTLTEGAYLQLRRDIIEGFHAPGTKLRVEHLKDRYGVGAGTLREALALLLSDALVEAEGQRGFRVSPISLADLEDLTRTRVMLETEALKRSIKAGDDEWEANLIAAYHRLSKAEDKLGERASPKIREWEMRNRNFHQALIGASDSQWLCYLLGLLYRHLAMTQSTTPRDVHAEHRDIFESTLARDAKRASQMLEAHIRLTFDSLSKLPPEFFAQAAAPMRRKVSAKMSG
jgi:DNA-binding GntR family transcriptional regulator